MLIIYPNCKIYFHKWCQFNLQEISFLIIYIFLYLIYVSTFNEDTKPGMLTCTDTKIWFHKDNLVKNFAQKIQNFSQSYPFLPLSPPGWRGIVARSGRPGGRAGGRPGGRAGGRAGGCQTCGTHISVTAWWIFSVRSSTELSRPVVVHCHAHLPHMGLPMGRKLVKFATNWIQTLRIAYLWNLSMDLPHLKFHGLV